MKKIKSKINIIQSLLWIAALVLLDQFTKYLAAAGLKDKEPFVLIDGVFELHYLENTSAAFGIDLISIIQKIFRFSYFTEHPDAFLLFKMRFFVLITIVVVILLYLLYLRIPQNKRFRYINWILVAFIAGAIGNCIDRSFHRYVVDFFCFKLINFPIFNVADIYVTVSAILLILFFLFYYREEDFEQIFPSSKEKIPSEEGKDSTADRKD